MTLIITLICIAIEQFTPKLSQHRNYHWLKQYMLWFRHAFPNLDGTTTLLLILGPIIILGALLFASVNALLWFLLAIFILYYCIGPDNTVIQVTDYLDANERGDIEAAMRYADKLNPYTHEMTTIEQAHQHVINAILTSTSERITAVLFWFLILGPLGALLYRCSEQLMRYSQTNEGETLQEAAQRLHFILAWLPTRLTAFSYALGGNMSDAWQNWRHYQSQWAQIYCDDNRGILICSGLGALQIEPSSRENELQNVQCALALANRAIIIWISFIAILTLTGFF